MATQSVLPLTSNRDFRVNTTQHLVSVMAQQALSIVWYDVRRACDVCMSCFGAVHANLSMALTGDVDIEKHPEDYGMDLYFTVAVAPVGWRPPKERASMAHAHWRGQGASGFHFTIISRKLQHKRTDATTAPPLIALAAAASLWQ